MKNYEMSFLGKMRYLCYSITHSKKRSSKNFYKFTTPNFPIIKNPKIVMVLLVRDESDIVEKNIRFHKAMGVDCCIVMDHCSKDGTIEIIKKLQCEGLVQELIEEKSEKYEQSKFVHRMINLAIKKYHADYVIPIDADEFWCPEGGNFKKIVSSFKGNLLYVQMFNMLDLEECWTNNELMVIHPLTESQIDDAVKKGTLSPFNQFNRQLCKVIIRASEYVGIEIGNHSATMKQNFSKTESKNIRIMHFSNRGYDHFKRKFIFGGETLRRTGMPKGTGIHWQYFYDQYRLGESPSKLYNLFRGKNIEEHLINKCCVTNTIIRDFFDLNNIKVNFPHVLTIEETLSLIIDNKLSIARFGDGEFDIGFTHQNKDDPYQNASRQLSDKLEMVLKSDDANLLVCIPSGPFRSENEKIIDGSIFTWWENYWIKNFKILKKYLTRANYGNAFISQIELFQHCNIDQIKKIWEGRDVVFVRSEDGRFIFVKELFDNINSFTTIDIPSRNAFSEYNRILNDCKKYDHNVLFFISAGPTATVLAYDLTKLGYQALDLGHLPNCYLQFKGGKVPEMLPISKIEFYKKENRLSRKISSWYKRNFRK